MTITQLLRFLSSAVAVTAISFTVLGQQYPINLDLREKAGLTYHLVTTSTDTTTTQITASGQLLKKAEDSVTVELVAKVIVIEAANGSAVRKRFTILSSKVVRGDRTSAILPEGTEVMASIQNGETVYEVNNKLVDEETARTLRPVIGLHSAGVGEDEMYGTPTPRKIGESWPVSVDATKKLLKEIGAEGGKQEITGTGTLEKVENNHAFVRSSVNVKDVRLTIKPGLTTESGEIQSELWGRFPVLADDITREFNARLRLSNFASGVDAEGKKVMVHVVQEGIVRYEITAIQK